MSTPLVIPFSFCPERTAIIALEFIFPVHYNYFYYVDIYAERICRHIFLGGGRLLILTLVIYSTCILLKLYYIGHHVVIYPC